MRAPCVRSFYMTNQTLSAAEALAVELVHEAIAGVRSAQKRALYVATAAHASLPKQCWAPQLADEEILIREAYGHAACRLENGGEVRIAGGSDSRAEQHLCMLSEQCVPQAVRCLPAMRCW